MKQLKNKKTGKIIEIISDEEYQKIVDNDNIGLNKFEVTDLRPLRSKTPIELEIKKPIKKEKNEG